MWIITNGKNLLPVYINIYFILLYVLYILHQSKINFFVTRTMSLINRIPKNLKFEDPQGLKERLGTFPEL